MTSIVVMGVAGCGKSTLAAEIARRMGGVFIEGDDYHTPTSITKMTGGIALDDVDRLAWLERVGVLLGGSGPAGVLACSALKRSHREILRSRRSGLSFVFIDIDQATAMRRVASRNGHLFPPRLVRSQFEVLERPEREADVLTLSAGLSLEHQAGAVERWLATTPFNSPVMTG